MSAVVRQVEAGVERDVAGERPGAGPRVPPGVPQPRSAPTRAQPTAPRPAGPADPTAVHPTAARAAGRADPTTVHPTAARGYGRADPTSVVSLSALPPPGQAPAEPPRPRSRWWALVAGLVVLALLGIGGVVVLTGGEAAPVPPPVPQPAPQPARPAPSAPSAPSAAVPAAPAPAVPADPASAQGRLDAQLRTDAAAVAALADRWVPQLYAERPGAVRGATTMDAGTILRDYTAVKAQYPDALLLASGDFTSFAMPGYYVVVQPRAFPTAQEALEWCATEDRGAEFCFAKLLSHTAGPDGSTVYRT